MTLSIYNSLTRRKERFKPIDADGKSVLMYVCGVTLYDQLHLGHARAAVVFDMIRRYLEYTGYRVKYVTNFTDVDDKMIKRAQELGTSVFELADKYVAEYFEQMAQLGVKQSSLYPRATENIDAIISLIGQLQQKGFAYVQDGDVYFRTRAFSKYGRLSGQSLDNMRAGARIAVQTKKEDPADFALWKRAKEGEPSWPSPWGEGRPGWHIECSAMAMRYLGESIDIHGGGQDLVFPHHENEVAQSEAATGKQFANYWVHNGLLTINAQKMAKSLANFMGLDETLKHYRGDVVRYYLLSAHYRSDLDLSPESLPRAQSSLETLEGTLHRIQAITGRGLSHPDSVRESALEKYREQFFAAMNDDFNTPAALAVLFELSREATRLLSGAAGSPTERKRLHLLGSTLKELGGILGMLQESSAFVAVDSKQLIETLLEVRHRLRQRNEFELADYIRNRLVQLNIVLEDTPQGTTWHPESMKKVPLDKSP